MTTIKEVYKSKDYLVFYKPSGLATVPLKAKAGGTFLDEVAKLYPEVLSVVGKNPWEGGTIHRLDTPTAGLVMFARNQEAFDWIISEQNHDRVEKRYIAIHSPSRSFNDGFELFPFDDVTKNRVVVSSYFRSFGPGAKAVRPVYNNKRNIKGKLYTTIVEPYSKNSSICTLTRGFRHQVRAHMAWAGLPLIGDTLYGGIQSDDFGLEAIGISFRAQSGEKISVSV